MAKYRKKPVVIDAIQWDGTLEGVRAIEAALPTLQTIALSSHPPTNKVSYWKIGTLEGGHEVSSGDWIITGVRGEHYPCKPNIFAATYDDAAQPSAEPSDPSASRKAAEHAYSTTAFNYPAHPVESRDWSLFWQGWQAREQTQPSQRTAPVEAVEALADIGERALAAAERADAVAERLKLRTEPSKLVRAAREMVERYEARLHGLRDLHPDDREAFDEAIDALRRALDAGDGAGEAASSALHHIICAESARTAKESAWHLQQARGALGRVLAAADKDGA